MGFRGWEDGESARCPYARRESLKLPYLRRCLFACVSGHKSNPRGQRGGQGKAEEEQGLAQARRPPLAKTGPRGWGNVETRSPTGFFRQERGQRNIFPLGLPLGKRKTREAPLLLLHCQGRSWLLGSRKGECLGCHKASGRTMQGWQQGQCRTALRDSLPQDAIMSLQPPFP